MRPNCRCLPLSVHHYVSLTMCLSASVAAAAGAVASGLASCPLATNNRWTAASYNKKEYGSNEEADDKNSCSTARILCPGCCQPPSTNSQQLEDTAADIGVAQTRRQCLVHQVACPSS